MRLAIGNYEIVADWAAVLFIWAVVACLLAHWLREPLTRLLPSDVKAPPFPSDYPMAPSLPECVLHAWSRIGDATVDLVNRKAGGGYVYLVLATFTGALAYALNLFALSICLPGNAGLDRFAAVGLLLALICLAALRDEKRGRAGRAYRLAFWSLACIIGVLGGYATLVVLEVQGFGGIAAYCGAIVAGLLRLVVSLAEAWAGARPLCSGLLPDLVLVIVGTVAFTSITVAVSTLLYLSYAIRVLWKWLCWLLGAVPAILRAILAVMLEIGALLVLAHWRRRPRRPAPPTLRLDDPVEGLAVQDQIRAAGSSPNGGPVRFYLESRGLLRPAESASVGPDGRFEGVIHLNGDHHGVCGRFALVVRAGHHQVRVRLFREPELRERHQVGLTGYRPSCQLVTGSHPREGDPSWVD